MVQMVKNILRRVLGKAFLYYEEIMSILCDCEAVINSCPFTYLSEDPDHLIPLTPALFLQNISTVGVPNLDQLDKKDIKKRWKYQQALREDLQRRFRREYLGKFVEQKDKTNYYKLEVGDIVLVENESKRKILWPLARIIEVYPGKEGNIRVVRIKTGNGNGEIVRPARRIYPLELGDTPWESAPDKTLNAAVPGIPSRFREEH